MTDYRPTRPPLGRLYFAASADDLESSRMLVSAGGVVGRTHVVTGRIFDPATSGRPGRPALVPPRDHRNPAPRPRGGRSQRGRPIASGAKRRRQYLRRGREPRTSPVRAAPARGIPGPRPRSRGNRRTTARGPGSSGGGARPASGLFERSDRTTSTFARGFQPPPRAESRRDRRVGRPRTSPYPGLGEGDSRPRRWIPPWLGRRWTGGDAPIPVERGDRSTPLLLSGALSLLDFQLVPSLESRVREGPLTFLARDPFAGGRLDGTRAAGSAVERGPWAGPIGSGIWRWSSAPCSASLT